MHHRDVTEIKKRTLCKLLHHSDTGQKVYPSERVWYLQRKVTWKKFV